jgi:hypothetical protein
MENVLWRALFNMAVGFDHGEQFMNIFSVFEEIQSSGDPLEPDWFGKGVFIYFCSPPSSTDLHNPPAVELPDSTPTQSLPGPSTTVPAHAESGEPKQLRVSSSDSSDDDNATDGIKKADPVGNRRKGKEKAVISPSRSYFAIHAVLVRFLCFYLCTGSPSPGVVSDDSHPKQSSGVEGKDEETLDEKKGPKKVRISAPSPSQSPEPSESSDSSDSSDDSESSEDPDDDVKPSKYAIGKESVETSESESGSDATPRTVRQGKKKAGSSSPAESSDETVEPSKVRGGKKKVMVSSTLVHSSSSEESDDNATASRVKSGKTKVAVNLGKKRQSNLKPKIPEVEPQRDPAMASVKRRREPDIPLVVEERPATEAVKKKEASRVIARIVPTKAAPEGLKMKLFPINPDREPLAHNFMVPENVVCFSIFILSFYAFR